MFVIFGTAHGPLDGWFSAMRKDFDTPLGVVRTDQAFIDRLAAHLSSSVAGRQIDLFADEMAHRYEHWIEFQAVMLQYVLGDRRPPRIVPILTGSFHEFVAEKAQPERGAEVEAFVAAVRAAAAGHSGKVCYVAGADFAHIGRRFGDVWSLDERRLSGQADDDRRLLEFACQCDARGFFAHVAQQNDRRRICGLSPIYTMLSVLGAVRGEMLRYDQAVEPDRSACVSFASVAYQP